MKAFGLQTRLARDLNVAGVADIPADIRQEIADAINAALQTLNAIAPFHSKTAFSGIALPAPLTIELTVENRSNEISGYDFASDEFYRTIRIEGDMVDNQPIGTNMLLHPYGGSSGTVNAILYGDAVQMPEPFESIASEELTVLETSHNAYAVNRPVKKGDRKIGHPTFFNVEENAANQSPAAPAVIRFERLPDRLYRLEGMFTLAPLRVKVVDLIAPGAELPIRGEMIESYLLPIARANLTTCRLWRNKDNKAKAVSDGESAESKYRTLAPSNIASARNKVGTPQGY